MSIWQQATAFVIGVLSVARLTRLLTQDTYPPVVWLRVHWEDLTDGTGWEKLATCLWCAAPYIAIPIGLWGWLTHFQTAWWVVNIWLAGSYLASMVVFHDGE